MDNYSPGTNFIRHLPTMFSDARRRRINSESNRRRMRRAFKTLARRKGYTSTTRRSYKRMPVGKRVGTVTSVKALQKTVKKLARHDKQSTGKMTFRSLGSASTTSGVGLQQLNNYMPMSTTILEIVLAQCKFFNPATPGTLTVGSLASGTYQRNALFENVSSIVKYTNNYQTNLNLKVYLCQVKDDTDITPQSLWAGAIPDASNLATNTQLGQYPTDFTGLTDVWNLKVIKNVMLKPGSTVTCSHSTGPFEYSSSTVDGHNLTYQREYKAYTFMAVLSGCLGHDSAVSEFSNTLAGIDVDHCTTYKVAYDAGINLEYCYVTNTKPTAFTNGGVQSQKPIVDNIGYSVS